MSSDGIETKLVTTKDLPPARHDKLPARQVLKLCRRLEILNRRHKDMPVQERRTMFINKFPDLALLYERNPYFFYAFTEPSVTSRRRAVYKKMIEIRIEMEEGRLDESDGNRMMGELCRANP